MFCGTDNILQNIPYIQSKCGEYFVKYYQSHKTLLWINMNNVMEDFWKVQSNLADENSDVCIFAYFCILFQSTGIEPKTLKYWIHNSKQKWKRQPGQGEEMIAAMDS